MIDTVVVMLGPLYFDPAAGRTQVESVRITYPDEMEELLKESLAKLENSKVKNLHIILQSSSISSLFYGDLILDTYWKHLRPGSEIGIHVLGSGFSPVQDGDVEEIEFFLEKRGSALLLEKNEADDSGNWVITAQKAKVAGDEQEPDAHPALEYPFGTLPSDLQGVADFINSEQCQRIVILAGAGMSTSSGIPDFRSKGGLYDTLRADRLTCDKHHQQAIQEDPTYALNINLFLDNPLPLLETNRPFILGTRNQQWKATLAHRFVELLHAKTNKLVRLYSQNIDGLEQQCDQLPEDKVIRVHGNMKQAHCAHCRELTDYDKFCDEVQCQIKDVAGQDPSAPAVSTPIACESCGRNTVKPNVVSFGEALPEAFAENVELDTSDADLLIVIGTSLKVAPANSIAWRVPDNAMRLVVNREAVGQDLGLNFDNGERDFLAAGGCEEVLLELMRHLGWLKDLESLLLSGGESSPKSKLPQSSEAMLKKQVLEST